LRFAAREVNAACKVEAKECGRLESICGCHILGRFKAQAQIVIKDDAVNQESSAN